MKLVQENDSKVVCTDGGSVLLEYVYRPEVPAKESPKPYFHPIRTLAGTAVTAFRPEDHLHHHGLCMTLSQVDHHNFWGGRTYQKEAGEYLDMNNNGRQEHAAWDVLETSNERAVMKETVRWLSVNGEHLMTDTRQFTISQVNRQDRSYVLDAAFRITNASRRSLTLGNFQSIGGLAGSFYTGFAFRASDRFAEITDAFEPSLMAAGGRDGVDAIHGASAPWMAMTGHDPATGAKSTVILIDQPGNPGYPNQWFVRWGYTQATFPMIADQPMILGGNGTLNLRYRVLIADGAWGRDKVAAKASSLSW